MTMQTESEKGNRKTKKEKAASKSGGEIVVMVVVIYQQYCQKHIPTLCTISKHRKSHTFASITSKLDIELFVRDVQQAAHKNTCTLHKFEK